MTWSINSKQSVNKADFSNQFRKNMIRYTRIGHSINVMCDLHVELMAKYRQITLPPWSCIRLNDRSNIKLVKLIVG